MKRITMNQYLSYSEVESLQIDPTSKCNLLCPQCARVYQGKVNPFLPLTELTPEDYDKIFTKDFIPQLKTVIFNGNYGDPVATRYIDYVIDKLLQQKMRKMTLFTNGSLKEKSWWKHLGKRFSGTSNHVVFSIDGLENTNAIYRINSNFKKIMENAKAYIQAGGRARWDFIVFEHNFHQLQEAKELAKKMGFEKFLEKYTARFTYGDYKKQEESYTVFNRKGHTVGFLKEPPRRKRTDFENVTKKYGSWSEYINSTPIHCKYKRDRRALFIDFEALVWPCCWLGAPAYFMFLEGKEKKQFDALRKKYGKNFNSLRHYTLEKILSHEWFASDLSQSWKNKIADTNNPKLFICGRTCGADYEFTSGPGYKNTKMHFLY